VGALVFLDYFRDRVSASTLIRMIARLRSFTTVTLM
jgi:hypothetical protein